VIQAPPSFVPVYPKSDEMHHLNCIVSGEANAVCFTAAVAVSAVAVGQLDSELLH